MTNSNELLPCPFCGGKDVQDRGAPGHYSVECRCHRGGFETRLGARNQWNTRAAIRPTAELELIRRLVDAYFEEKRAWRLAVAREGVGTYEACKRASQAMELAAIEATAHLNEAEGKK